MMTSDHAAVSACSPGGEDRRRARSACVRRFTPRAVVGSATCHRSDRDAPSVQRITEVAASCGSLARAQAVRTSSPVRRDRRGRGSSVDRRFCDRARLRGSSTNLRPSWDRRVCDLARFREDSTNLLPLRPLDRGGGGNPPKGRRIAKDRCRCDGGGCRAYAVLRRCTLREPHIGPRVDVVTGDAATSAGAARMVVVSAAREMPSMEADRETRRHRPHRRQ
jgi:hypothetical protein